MLRVARRGDGDIVADPGGRAPGRGAYVHREAVCIETAIAKGGLARVLRASVPHDAAGRLRAFIDGE